MGMQHRLGCCLPKTVLRHQTVNEHWKEGELITMNVHAGVSYGCCHVVILAARQHHPVVSNGAATIFTLTHRLHNNAIASSPAVNCQIRWCCAAITTTVCQIRRRCCAAIKFYHHHHHQRRQACMLPTLRIQPGQTRLVRILSGTQRLRQKPCIHAKGKCTCAMCKLGL